MQFTYEDLTLRTQIPQDTQPLTAIMTKAFDEDSHLHRGVPGGPPGYNDGTFITKWGLETPGCTPLTILQGDTMIGSVMLWLHPQEHTGILGAIFLDPSTRRKGLGQKVWRFVEQQWPMIKTWSVETPGFSVRNHNFYINKLGFEVVQIDDPFDAHNSMYKMVKYLQ